MKYLLLLRGVNVGGTNAVKMSLLKEIFEKSGFTNVVTYINSGNIIFQTEERKRQRLEKKIDVLLKNTFFAIKTVILSQTELAHVVEHIPHRWKSEDLRKYIAFVKSPQKPDEVIKQVQLKDNIDFVEKGSGVVYMSTMMSGLTQSGFPKLIAKKIYQEITMRNYNTVQKLLTLMEQN